MTRCCAQGRFADNVPAAGQLHACVRSPHPHARICADRRWRRGAMPGVAHSHRPRFARRWRSADSQLGRFQARGDGTPTATPLRHALAIDTVRFVGGRSSP
jgi:carbon-monoxide dehydrogenase large subunit